jgi:hypothetical protein
MVLSIPRMDSLVQVIVESWRNGCRVTEDFNYFAFVQNEALQ